MKDHMENKTDKEKDVALKNKLTHKHTILHCADFYRSKAKKELLFFFLCTSIHYCSRHCYLSIEGVLGTNAGIQRL
jgi:hypothetical protein